MSDEQAAPEPDAGSAAPESGRGAVGAAEDESAVGLAAVECDPQQPSPGDERDALRRERDDLRDQLLRRRAEFENFRKRVERDRQTTGQEVLARALTALIPTLDNLERALGAEAPEGALRDGVRLIHRDLLAALEGLGLRAEDPTGGPFDPERHQALTHEPVPGFAEDAVVQVLGKGYALGDRLLRPALVRVAKADSGTHEAGPVTLN